MASLIELHERKIYHLQVHMRISYLLTSWVIIIKILNGATLKLQDGAHSMIDSLILNVHFRLPLDQELINNMVRYTKVSK